MPLVNETLTVIQKPYETGYINGYLEVLSKTYNKRFVHPDDFRLLSGFFLQRQASGNLPSDVMIMLQEQKDLNIGALVSSGQGIILTSLKDTALSTLEILVQPWLPPDEAEDLLLLIRNQIAGDFDKYRCWFADADPAEKLNPSSYVSSNLLVLENEDQVLILGFVISNHYL